MSFYTITTTYIIAPTKRLVTKARRGNIAKACIGKAASLASLLKAARRV
jgi:hypothetical protein